MGGVLRAKVQGKNAMMNAEVNTSEGHAASIAQTEKYAGEIVLPSCDKVLKCVAEARLALDAANASTSFEAIEKATALVDRTFKLQLKTQEHAREMLSLVIHSENEGFEPVVLEALENIMSCLDGLRTPSEKLQAKMRSAN
jgi:hypothetical protein